MTFCRLAELEADAELEASSDAWDALPRGLGRAQPELLVLSELPFGPWIASRSEFDPQTWNASLRAHERGIDALEQLGVPRPGRRRAVGRSDRVSRGGSWGEAGSGVR